MTRRLLLIFALFACCPASMSSAEEPAAAVAEKKLPTVFIIGDSISLGYTAPVTKLLTGRAIVTRPNTNCQHTGVGLEQLETWLGDKKFDVIHFNWGIWDTHFMTNDSNALVALETEFDPNKMHIRHSPEQYAENLRKLVKTLKGSSEKLIFATTTPIWKDDTLRGDNIAKYNEVALKVMEEEGVSIDDLYTFVTPHRAEWQSADTVHFNATGNLHLAQAVNESILKALAAPAVEKQP